MGYRNDDDDSDSDDVDDDVGGNKGVCSLILCVGVFVGWLVSIRIYIMLLLLLLLLLLLHVSFFGVNGVAGSERPGLRRD